MRVGEKEVSERAAIVARYADLFTRAPARRAARRPRRSRPAATSASGSTGCARPARRASSPPSSPSARTRWRTRSSPPASSSRARSCRCAPRRPSSPCCRTTPSATSSARLQADASRRRFNDERLERPARRRGARGRDQRQLDDPIARTEEEKGISLRELERALAAASDAADGVYAALRERWFERLLGPEREAIAVFVPRLVHAPPLAAREHLHEGAARSRSAWTRSSALGFDLEAEPNIKLDLDDRPQKSPRACVIPSDPPKIVHLITRAQGGLHDYQAFLHEAGHALHYAGVDPALPYTFRNISPRPRADRDLLVHRRGDLARSRAGTRATSASPTSRPPRTPRRRSFMEALLFRRYVAKLQFELDFWGRFAEDGGTSTRLRGAPDRRDRRALPGRRLPGRHGRRLLLGRLPARLDPLGPAPLLPGARDRRRLVGAARRRASACARSSPRARGRRARTSPAGSASSRSTPGRSSPSSAPETRKPRVSGAFEEAHTGFEPVPPP